MEKAEVQQYFQRHPAEQEVLQFLCDGLTYKQISIKRFCSFATVKTEVEHIYTLFRVHNTARAVACGLHFEVIVIRNIGE